MRLLVYLILFIHAFCFCENKVIYLISAPRSMSTFFVKLMDTRDDFKVYCEPLTPVYFKNTNVCIGSASYDMNCSISSFKKEIHKAQQKKHVFVKDIGFFFLYSMKELKNIIRDENTYFIFLVRNPHYSIISYVKNFKLPPAVDFHLSPVYKVYEEVDSGC